MNALLLRFCFRMLSPLLCCSRRAFRSSDWIVESVGTCMPSRPLRIGRFRTHLLEKPYPKRVKNERAPKCPLRIQRYAVWCTERGGKVLGSFRLAKINRLSDGFALAGYTLYSVYACMLFHSPTAISSFTPFGEISTFWFLIALLTGRVCGYVFYSLFPSRRAAPRHAQMALLVISVLALLGFVVVGMALSFSSMVFDVAKTLPWLCVGALCWEAPMRRWWSVCWDVLSLLVCATRICFLS